MISLKDVLREAREGHRAIGHFNISDTVTLKAIFQSAKKFGVPVLIGVSEGERSFIGTREAAVLVRSLREEHDFPIYLNADHTHSADKIKEAVAAGFDAVLFDGGKLSFEENIAQTKAVVEYVKSKNPNILVEGELGYIGSSSEIFDKLPEGAAIRPEDLTKPEDAARFVRETGVDLLAPAVGNVHGMFKNAPNPRLDIERIRMICEISGVPMVLHGGSGTSDDDFRAAITAGVSIIHINTEIRLAWKEGLAAGLAEHPNEVAPYKLLEKALDKVSEVVYNRLTLFSRKS
ncbi:MAG: class II fructose-bisphosphate aldolase [Patescibacteria group bacterium]